MILTHRCGFQHSNSSLSYLNIHWSVIQMWFSVLYHWIYVTLTYRCGSQHFNLCQFYYTLIRDTSVFFCTLCDLNIQVWFSVLWSHTNIQIWLCFNKLDTAICFKLKGYEFTNMHKDWNLFLSHSFNFFSFLFVCFFFQTIKEWL